MRERDAHGAAIMRVIPDSRFNPLEDGHNLDAGCSIQGIRGLVCQMISAHRDLRLGDLIGYSVVQTRVCIAQCRVGLLDFDFTDFGIS